ncbi:MAG: methylmalonyl-CoA mutase family protein [Opitutales bacterium]
MSDLEPQASNGQGQGRLLEAFAVPTYEEWKAAAEKLLKGAPFEKKMLTRTPEGITLQPIYRREDAAAKGLLTAPAPGQGDYLRGTQPLGYRLQAWEMAQELPCSLPEEFNEVLLAALNRGQNAVNLLLDIASQNGVDPDSAADGEVGACGVSIATVGDLASALDGVYLTAVPLHVQCGASALPFAALLQAYLNKAGIDTQAVRGSLGADPLGVLARAGRLDISLQQAFDEMAWLQQWHTTNAPQLRVFGPSGLPFAGAGASAVEELAFTLASATDTFRALGEREVDIEDAAKLTRMNLSVGPQFFMEVAKLRAARQLWHKVVRAFGGSAEAAKLQLHARTGLYNKTVVDPYVNLLRSTTEGLAAVIGGVDSLHVGPFDEIFRVPDAFSRRIALNTQVMLAEECDLQAVVDPAGGCLFIEDLTAEVARQAWALFQEVESQGGLLEALNKGWVQERIAATAAQREKLHDQRRSTQIGCNLFPNLQEQHLASNVPNYAQLRRTRAEAVAQYRISGDVEGDAAIVERLSAIASSDGARVFSKMIEAAGAGASLGEVARSLRGADAEKAKPTVQPVPFKRLSQKYEGLRLAARYYAEKHEHGPKLYLANIGPLRQHKLRADFTRGFFETGGFEVLYPKGQDDPAQAAEEAIASGARVAVICSTDDAYVEAVPAFCRALKGKDSGIKVLLAGDPGEQQEAYAAAGLDDFISIRSNNYDTVRKYLEHVGAV